MLLSQLVSCCQNPKRAGRVKSHGFASTDIFLRSSDTAQLAHMDIPKKEKSKKTKEDKKKDSKSSKKGETEDKEGKDAAKEKKPSWVDKKKRGVASSGLGRAVIESYLDSETKLLITTVSQMVAAAADEKAGKQVKEIIFKVAGKTAILFQDGVITAQQFDSLMVYFRRICSAVRNGYLTKTLSPETAERIANVASTFGNGVKNILQPHLSEGSMKQIDYLMDTLCSPQFLLQASKYPDFDKVAMVLTHYLQETS